jgi:hypothetical protein
MKVMLGPENLNMIPAQKSNLYCTLQVGYFGNAGFLISSLASMKAWLELKIAPNYYNICPTSITTFGA